MKTVKVYFYVDGECLKGFSILVTICDDKDQYKQLEEVLRCVDEHFALCEKAFRAVFVLCGSRYTVERSVL